MDRVIVAGMETQLTELESFLGRNLKEVGTPLSESGYERKDAVTVPVETPAGIGQEIHLVVLSAPTDSGEKQTWALAFVSVAGQRVRTESGDYVGLTYRGGAWHCDGWEKDEYDEWSDEGWSPDDGG